MEFQWKSSSVRMGGNKPNKQLSEIENFMTFCKSREEVMKFCYEYFMMVHKVAYDSKYGKDLKMLTLKQILQRLSIVLVQVKADNTSENLLNKIRQIIYYLYLEKEITKKVHNNIMKSIKL